MEINNPIHVAVSIFVSAVFILTCFLLEERVVRVRTRSSKKPGVFLFGRRYFSTTVLDWEGHGTGHAHRMTGIERAAYGR